VRATWRALAGHRDLRPVLSAGVISQTGDWILMIGLLYRVYAMTGSTLASAITLLANLVPQGRRIRGLRPADDGGAPVSGGKGGGKRRERHPPKSLRTG
jgi:hypothetical protein